jgi:hypothetical protein
MDQEPDINPVGPRSNATSVPSAIVHVKRRRYLKRGMRRGGGSVNICAPIRAFPNSQGRLCRPSFCYELAMVCVALSRVWASTIRVVPRLGYGLWLAFVDEGNFPGAQRS